MIGNAHIPTAPEAAPLLYKGFTRDTDAAVVALHPDPCSGLRRSPPAQQPREEEGLRD